MVFAAVVSFVIVVSLSPRMIRWLVRKKLGDRPEFDNTALNELTKHKSSTPTMGGLLVVAAIFVSVLLFADSGVFYIRMALLALVWLGALGGVDDWFKLCKNAPGNTDKSRDGLKMWQKILFQIALAMLLAIFVSEHGRDSTYMDYEGRAINAVQSFYLPFKAQPLHMPLWLFVSVAVLVIVGSSNAVNLTDGMDGLAGGCMVVVTGVFLILSWVAGVQAWANLFRLPFVPQAAEMTIVCAAMIGACIGFLWYNCLPAQYFMGDTGSLPLGGLIGFIAVVTRHELTLLIAGGVFVMEALSVLLQVTYYKSTKGKGPDGKGKRLFKCAPIHHHFHLMGWAESKVVVRFWLLCIICAAVAMATLKLR